MATVSGSNADVWESEATNEHCVRPLPGREAEYEAVVSFVDARLHTLVHHNSLFVFGACGCGKTSTVLRAMRSFTRQSMPSDRQQKPVGRAAGKNSHAASSSGPLSSTRKRAAKDVATGASSSAAPSVLATTTILSQAVKRAKVEAVPCDVEAGRASLGNASSDTSPASAAHVSPMSGTPRSATTTSNRSSTDLIESDKEMDRELFGCLSTDTEAEKSVEISAAAAVLPYSPEYFSFRYPRLYDQRTAPSSLSAKSSASASQFVQAHYINCADLDAHHLAEALHKTIACTAGRKADAATQSLLKLIEALPQTARRHAASLRATGSAGVGALDDSAQEADARRTSIATSSSHSATRKPTLHVVALDEVEYVRGVQARDALSCLSTLSLTHPTQLALIFISNHRDLVHVPRVLLEELPFEPYNIAQLKSIGSAVVQREIEAAAEREQADANAKAPTAGVKRQRRTVSQGRSKPSPTLSETEAASARALVQISPTLLEYIARKALLDYSGDVRQVMAMCRRVIFTALQETRAAPSTEAEAVVQPASNQKRTKAGVGAGDGRAKNKAAAPQPLDAALEAAVASFSATPRPTSASSSTRSSGAHTDATDAAAGTSRGTVPPAPRAHTLTLANTASLLHGTAVETQVQRHISTMPEQQLYVLCCLLVLTIRHQRDASRAAVAIGGAPNARARHSGASASSSSSLAMREVHQLYTGLMGLRHFPSMNVAGITTAVDGLADLGIITRPQRRGNEQVFSFNGTWSLDAMQGALETRGEALRQELQSCGLDASENKFTTVLRELKGLAGLQGFT